MRVMCEYINSENWCECKELIGLYNQHATHPNNKISTFLCPISKTGDVVKQNPQHVCKWYKKKDVVIYKLISTHGDLIAEFSTLTNSSAEYDANDLLKQLSDVQLVIE